MKIKFELQNRHGFHIKLEIFLNKLLLAKQHPSANSKNDLFHVWIS